VVAVVAELLDHPLSVDTMFFSMVEDVNLPEAEQELPFDRIAHDGGRITPTASSHSLTSPFRLPPHSQREDAIEQPLV